MQTSTALHADQLQSMANLERSHNRPSYKHFSLFLLILMVASVLPYALTATAAETPFSLALFIHAVMYVGWYILFVVQSNLIAAGNVRLHRTFGYSSIALFALLVISGFVMLRGVVASYSVEWDPGHLHVRTSFVWAIVHTLASFSVFYILALLYRKRPSAHPRLMLLASLSMVSASVTRLAYLPGVPIDGTMLTLLSTYALLLTPIVIDLVRYKRVHSALKWGVPLYIITQLACIAVIPTTAIGRTIAFPLST